MQTLSQTGGLLLVCESGVRIVQSISLRRRQLRLKRNQKQEENAKRYKKCSSHNDHKIMIKRIVEFRK